MQIKIKKLLVVLIVLVLLGIGCVKETPQNREVSKNNQNASNQNTPNQNSSNNNATPPPLCTGNIDEKVLKDEINKLPALLKNQFKEVNPKTGTISLSYKERALTFNGYITGVASNLSQLINTYDRFRGENCVRIAYFEGAVAGENFEWRPEKLPNPPGDCKKSVEDIINNSSVKDQINKNLFYEFNEQTKVLIFSGTLDDKPGNGRFTSLLAQLNQPMINGCISKIIFAQDPKIVQTAMSEREFSWQICEGGLVECKGECVIPPCS
ncbi:MAG TPA: hypothetical protein VK892_02325 [Pyrinomonadaceae bacterium]|nr:hypothetical protein [Pyrinomonadaceae bacterium]